MKLSIDAFLASLDGWDTMPTALNNLGYHGPNVADSINLFLSDHGLPDSAQLTVFANGYMLEQNLQSKIFREDVFLQLEELVKEYHQQLQYCVDTLKHPLDKAKTDAWRHVKASYEKSSLERLGIQYDPVVKIINASTVTKAESKVVGVTLRDARGKLSLCSHWMGGVFVQAFHRYPHLIPSPHTALDQSTCAELGAALRKDGLSINVNKIFTKLIVANANNPRNHRHVAPSPTSNDSLTVFRENLDGSPCDTDNGAASATPAPLLDMTLHNSSEAQRMTMLQMIDAGFQQDDVILDSMLKAIDTQINAIDLDAEAFALDLQNREEAITLRKKIEKMQQENRTCRQRLLQSMNASPHYSDDAQTDSM